LASELTEPVAVAQRRHKVANHAASDCNDDADDNDLRSPLADLHEYSLSVLERQM
jgi:hypothetical protein